MKNDLLLLDVSAIFHRSRSALTRTMGEMITSSGVPVTGTYGTLNTIFSILGNGEYDCVIPCFDAGGNFRKKESDTYKGNRTKSSMEHYADLGLLLEDVFPALGMTPVGAKGWEADDVIATISRKSPAYREVHILTVDADLLQLVTDKVKVILFNSAKKVKTYGVEDVVEKFGVMPQEVKYFKALAGDKSDNVAGIPKVGPKTAVKIIEESRPQDENDFLSAADKIAFHPKVKEKAVDFYANLRLVTLEANIPDLNWFASSAPIPMHVEALFESLEFKSFTKRKGKILQALGCTEQV